jgi:hypothetical protein
VRPSRRKRRTFILYAFALRYVARLCRSPKQVFPSCKVPAHGGWVTGRLICLFCATSPSGDNDNKRRWESKTDDCERRPYNNGRRQDDSASAPCQLRTCRFSPGSRCVGSVLRVERRIEMPLEGGEIGKAG